MLDATRSLRHSSAHLRSLVVDDAHDADRHLPEASLAQATPVHGEDGGYGGGSGQRTQLGGQVVQAAPRLGALQIGRQDQQRHLSRREKSYIKILNGE